MATIDIENVTNEEETGIFDKLMKSINSNIEKQYLNNRITGSDYATVYLGSMQAALSQSIQFSLQEDMVEAQIAGVLADNLLKADQLLTSGIDRASKVFELENLLPEQLLKIQEEIDILQTQDSELLLDGVKKRLIMDEELQSADLQQIILATEEELKTAQLAEVLDSTIRNNTQVSDGLLTSAKQRIILDEEKESADLQQIILATEEELKTAQKDELLASTTRSDTQLADSLLTTIKQRLVLDEEIQSADLQQLILATEEELKRSQKDEMLASTTRKNTELTDSLLTTAKQRILLDEEVESANLQQVLFTEQTKTTYTDRTLKDKQAAKLGMDNVMKLSEDSRKRDPNFIYTPNYEGV
jgi:hypothetical protein